MSKSRCFEFRGKTYKLTPKADEKLFPQKGTDLEQSLWVNRNTYAKGYQKEKVRLPQISVTVK